MERIVFLERNTIPSDFRRPNFDHEWIEYPETAADQVVARAREATIIISNKLSLGAPQLAHAPHLKLIAIAATGSDCVDLNYCRTRGIAVCNVRGYAANSVPEHALMMILALRRGLLAYRSDVERGLWNQSKQFCLLTHELHDIRHSTLGVIGYGAIGKSMAQLGRAVGMTVLISEHKRAGTLREGRTSFVETLRQSDVVTLHCPLNEETQDLIGSTELQMMKSTALLINTARGALINDAALIQALQNRVITGAGLDTSAQKRAIVVISDGLDRGSTWKFQQVLNTLQSLDIVVYCVQAQDRTRGAIRRDVPKPRQVINDLAEGTGGRIFPIEDSRAAASAICDELRKNRYVLSYLPQSVPLSEPRRLLVMGERGVDARSKTMQPVN